MNPQRPLPTVGPAPLAWWRPWVAVALMVLLASCGGGVGTGGTGTYASGPITGLGSIIVNDVRFDETAATVLDDDGGSRLRSELQLGMTVDIDAGAVRGSGSDAAATATRVLFGSELLGPVQSVDVAAGSFTVLGQTVRVAVDTVLDASLSGGLGALSVEQWVEVYAQFDPAALRYDATRVEPKAAQVQARLRGPVVSVDTTASTLRLGSADFAYAGASGVPAGLSAGSFVRLRVSPTAVAGRYAVVSFGVALRAPEDRDEARLRGRITAFASAASFSINGLAVDASAASFPDGSAGLRVGARVEAEGTSSGGVLRATRVKAETEDQREQRGFELKGAVESVDLAGATVVVRGTRVSLARAGLVFDGGVLADLVVGRQVEIKAALSADRTRLEATSIRFR